MKSLLGDDRGATMVEYGFMLLLIALVCIGTITAVGTSLDGLYQQVLAAL